LTELGVTDRELKHKLVQRYKKTVTKEQEPSFEKYRRNSSCMMLTLKTMAEFCPAYEELAGKLGNSPHQTKNRANICMPLPRMIVIDKTGQPVSFGSW